MPQDPDVSSRLRPYLPRLLIHWLSEAPGTTVRAVDGTIVFVDISGFTKMSERLARKGKVGAEEVTDVLGSVFAQLLTVAYENGGGLVKFGGDALLLFFSGTDHQVKGARAAFGMRRMLREVGRIQSSAGLITLRMSVGVHSGTFHLFLVGDSHRELLIAGPAASETVHMEGTAGAGDIVVSSATAAALPPDVLGAAKGDGWLLKREPSGPGPERVDEETSVEGIDLSGSVPLAIRDHLLAGQVDAEHRQVTVAFIHFDGIDAMVNEQDADAVGFGLDQLVGETQRAADKHGVTFLGTDIDHDGGKIILVAGAPAAMGDDEERMLLTVRTIMDAEPPIPIRIGVNKGPVFAGDIGPRYRRTYTIMGDAVNLAARVMAKALPGQILATASVLDASNLLFTTEALEPFLVKGKALPVRAWSVGAIEGPRHHAEERRLPLVGRDDELAAFSRALGDLRQGHGSVVELVGNPGIGKTRLVEELIALAADLPHAAMACELFEASSPYRPFRRMLRRLMGIEQRATGAEAGARLRAAVAAAAPDLLPWLPLLAVVVDAEVEPTPEVDALAEEFRRGRLEEVTEALLAKIATDPIVIVVEDAHWVDEPSAGLLRAIAERVTERPWLVCVTRRDTDTGFTIPPEADGCISLRPLPLTEVEAETLLQAATEDDPLRPDELTALTKRSGGNPLFLQEIASAARAGDIDELPSSVEGMVTAQIDRLASKDRRVLRFASVLGSSFSQDLLATLMEGEPAPEDAVWARLGEFLDAEGSGRWRFRHALMRDAAYEGLPFSRRRALHARAGAAILEHAAEPDEVAELLSLHFFNAHRHDDAWTYSKLAGDRAKAKFANTEAATFYERAAESGKRLGVATHDLAAVYESLGDVRWTLGAYRDTDTAYGLARRLRVDDPAGQAGLWHKTARIPYKLGRFSQSIRDINRGLAVIEGIDEPEAIRQRTQLIALRAGIRSVQARYGEAQKSCMWLIEHVPQMDPDPVVRDSLARAYYILDLCYAEQGRLDLATNWQRALDIYQELGKLGTEGEVRVAGGNWAYYAGRWDEALEQWERARELQLQVGDAVEAAWSSNNIGEIRSDQGRLDEAEALFKEARRVHQATNTVEGLGFAASNLGRVASRSGRFDDAMRLFTEARAIFESAGAHALVLDTDARIAECLALKEDWDRASEVAERALTKALAVDGVAVQTPMLHRIKGGALLRTGFPGEARAALEESLRSAHARQARYEVAMTLDALIAMDLAEGREPDRAHVEERDQIFEGLGVVAPPRVL
jgi:class 3 adenylate cyclase/tetratricopeptide (TPR) repeat protein